MVHSHLTSMFPPPPPCHRPVGLRDNERFTVTQDASGHHTVHAWGWVDGSGCGELHRIVGTHNSESYVDILEQVRMIDLYLINPIKQWKGKRYY